MDDIVKRAIQKWPNVPNVFGWLRLDRRGNWWIKSRLVKSRQTREGPPLFDRITNGAVIEFIGRNYQSDDRGRWFFQNGPQRVFVTLESTPFIYRLRGEGAGVEAHTGATATELRSAWLDEAGQLLLETDLGIGLLLDRDLQAVEKRISGAEGAPLAEHALGALGSGGVDAPPAYLTLAGARLRIGRIAPGE